MTDTSQPITDQDVQDRPVKPAILKGLRLKCPNCGKGKLLHSYLKVNDTCSECGQELFHQRADDGPAYLTILLVAHILGFGLHFIYGQFRPEPLTLALTLSAITVGASLFLLPRMKGFIVAYQWAKRLNGF